MTDEELNTARELAATATPGPWRLHGYAAEVVDEGGMHTLANCCTYGTRLNGGTLDEHANASFIAASRTLVPALLAEVYRLRNRQQELLATIVRVTNETPFSDEAKDALAQRGALLAEVGTLKASVTHWKREASAAMVRAATAEQAAAGLSARLAEIAKEAGVE